MLDRIDLQIEIAPVAFDEISFNAPTIADLAGCETVQAAHIQEAIGCRNLDRANWAL